jgi:hypothetical protein
MAVSVLIIAAVAMVYFQIYFHYWLVKALGGYVISTLVPIAGLLIPAVAFIANEKVFGQNSIARERAPWLWLCLSAYLLLASCSILLNEHSFQDVKASFVYIVSPPLIFAALVEIYGRVSLLTLERSLKVLFIGGVVFSLYAVYLYVDPTSPTPNEMEAIETERGTIYGDSGATYGFGDSWSIRLTIPGLSSTTYGPMLVPLILCGYYFMRHARGLERHLYGCAVALLGVCVVMTISRGPLFALSGGILYLVWKRWIGLKEGVAISLVSLLAFATFGHLSFLRVLTTLYEMLPLDAVFPLPTVGTEILEDIYDPHRSSMAESLSYIAVNPFFGMGRFLFQALGDMSFGNEHNNYLSIAASYGLPVLVMYLMFLLVLFVELETCLAKSAQDSRSKDTGVLLGAGTVALLIYLNGSPAEFHFIWVWLGFTGAWIVNPQRQIPIAISPERSSQSQLP